MNDYPESYYKSGNYISYLDKSERYIKLSEDIYDLFRKICILPQDSILSWLDYGSGPGLFVEALKQLPIKIKISAFDISEWSKIQLTKKGYKIADLSIESKYDIISFLDVLEHMTDTEISNLFKKLTGEILLVRIPVASDTTLKFNKFFLEISNLDKTHINCKTKNMWEKFFNTLGYKFFLKLNLSSIYDSEGVFCALFKKQY